MESFLRMYWYGGNLNINATATAQQASVCSKKDRQRLIALRGRFGKGSDGFDD